MMVSTKGRYALRLMMDIAVHEAQGPVTIREIAARQEISVKYLEQIISTLAKAGYVHSTRGAGGGYRLTKPAGEYTAGMILRLTEGNLAPVECLSTEINACKRSGECRTLKLWQELDGAIKSVVDKYTLEDLINPIDR